MVDRSCVRRRPHDGDGREAGCRRRRPTGNAAPGRDVLVSRTPDYVRGCERGAGETRAEGVADRTSSRPEGAARCDGTARPEGHEEGVGAGGAQRLAELQVEGGGTDLMQLGSFAVRFASTHDAVAGGFRAIAARAVRWDNSPARRKPAEEQTRSAVGTADPAARALVPLRATAGVVAPGARRTTAPARADGGHKPPPPTSMRRSKRSMYGLAGEAAKRHHVAAAGQAKTVDTPTTFMLVEGPAEAADRRWARGRLTCSLRAGRRRRAMAPGAAHQGRWQPGRPGGAAASGTCPSSGVRAITDQPLDADACAEHRPVPTEAPRTAPSQNPRPPGGDGARHAGSVAVGQRGHGAGRHRRNSAEESAARPVRPESELWLIRRRRDVKHGGVEGAGPAQ